MDILLSDQLPSEAFESRFPLQNNLKVPEVTSEFKRLSPVLSLSGTGDLLFRDSTNSFPKYSIISPAYEIGWKGRWMSELPRD